MTLQLRLNGHEHEPYGGTEFSHSWARYRVEPGRPDHLAVGGRGSQMCRSGDVTHVLDELTRSAAGQMDAYLRDLAGGEPDAATGPAS